MSKVNKNTFINKVNTYYDNNSALFLKLGVDKSHFNIHQPLWPSTIKSQSEAANYSNLKIAETIESLLKISFEKVSNEKTSINKTPPKTPKKASLNIVDLGCGVGGSLLFLRQYFQSELFQFSGLTLSQKQVDIAQRIINETNKLIQIQQGNFQEATKHFNQVDVIFMIEAFVHSPDYEVLIEQVSQSLSPNGLFIVIDDCLNVSSTTPSQTSLQTKWINQYTNNWLIGSLISTQQLEKICNQNQLILKQSDNFTPYIKTDFRNKLLRLINLPLTLWPIQSTYINSVVGGIARHYCLKQNWINYKMQVFQKG